MKKNNIIEKQVDINVYNKLISCGFGNQSRFLIEQDKSENYYITEGLKNASKNIKDDKIGNQPGKPDFIIQCLGQFSDTVLIIENKGDTNKHIIASTNKNSIKDGAVNGVLYYAGALSDPSNEHPYNVFAIGYSEDKKETLCSIYYYPKGSTAYIELKEIKDIASFDILQAELKKQFKPIIDPIEKETHLKKITTELNDDMRDYLELEEEKRATLAASILLSLKDSMFKASYSMTLSTKELAEFLYSSVARRIESKNLSSKEKNAILNSISFIKIINNNDNGKSKFGDNALKYLIDKFRNEIFIHFQNSEYDVIGFFFSSFLKYATKGGGDLGVVLTPNHIAELFVRLTKVDANSRVLDPAMGTGSFLVKAWDKIQSDINQKMNMNFSSFDSSIALGGIELKPSMFTLSYLNMLLHGDGDSKFSLDSSLDSKVLKDFKDKFNVGLINPPYSHGSAPELEFVEKLMDTLLPGSLCAAIIPVNSVSKQSKKHGNLSAVKSRIFKKHKLLASIQMPVQLFYPKGTETVVLLFETSKKHEGETWFSIWDDEFKVIKQRGRIQVGDTDKSLEILLQNFENRIVTDKSFNKKVSSDDQWVYNVLKDEVAELDYNLLEETIKDYESFMFINDMEEKNNE